MHGKVDGWWIAAGRGWSGLVGARREGSGNADRACAEKRDVPGAPFKILKAHPPPTIKNNEYVQYFCFRMCVCILSYPPPPPSPAFF